jgi:hypothetical protein
MTRDAFTIGMANLMVWYKPHPSDLEIDACFRELEEIPDADFSRVVDTIIKTRPFPDFPKPADFWTVYTELDKPPKTAEDLRQQYSCATCTDTPGWVTYWVTSAGRRTDKNFADAHFTASPCPQCELGRLILEKTFPKKMLDNTDGSA